MKAKSTRAVAAFAFCMALVPPLFGQDTCSHPRIISVTGNAEIKVAPDEVALTLGVDSHDKDLAVAKVDNDKRIKKLLNLAHAAGVESKNIQTSALTMGPEYSDEKIPKLLGYQVSQTVAVTLTDLSKYEDLMTNALKVGVNRVDGINFFVADPKKYREDARLKAVQAAREKAVAMASQLGQTIGKPWEVTEGTDFDANDYATPNFLNSRGNFGKLALQLPEATVAGGEVIIRAFVRVSFQLE
jgi:uncharacterized protein YggE